MAIAPITEAQVMGLTGIPQGSHRSGSAKEAGGSDFLQAFTNAQDYNKSNDLQAAKSEGTGAQGKDSKNTADQNRTQTKKSGDQNVRRNETQKAQRPEQTTKTDDTADSENVTDVQEEFAEEEAGAAAAAQQLLADIAQMLQIRPEDLQGALDELGLDASALLESGTINELVAQVAADGDLSALVTDSNLADLAKELNTMVSEMVGQLQEENAGVDPQTLKQILADALTQAAEETPVTEEAVPVNEMPQTLAENEGDDTQKELADKRRERSDRFEERAMDAVAQLNADAANADVADIADTVRTQTEQLRYTTNPQEIMDQVLDQIKTQVKENMTSLDMVLHPASLGHVALNLTSRDGAVTAQLTAQNESVREALQSQIQILKENLEQAGVKIEAVEVTVSAHAFEQNLEQGNDGESDAQMQERERLRRATHKINLGGSDGEGIEGIDELGEAEAVNVAMMQADGRRLDYRG